MSRRYTAAQKASYYEKQARSSKKTYKKAKRSKPKYKKSYKSGGQVVKNAKGGGWMTAAGAGIGGLIGSAVAPGVGTGIGASIGAGAGGLLSYLTGVGEYKLHKNVFANGAPPAMVNRDTHGGVTVRNREYICDIISGASGTFNVEVFPIQPGLTSSFPLLSEIAQGFDQYEFQGLAYEFRSMSGDALNSTNTALGTVCMATNYNAAQPAFGSKAAMENYEFGQSVRPSSSCLHLVECEKGQMVLDNQYVRTGAVPAGQDVRFYDHGNFEIATAGMQGSYVNVGELWVTYQVKFLRPKMYSALGLATKYAHYYTGTGINNANPLGTSTLAALGTGVGNTLRLGTIVQLENNVADVCVTPDSLIFACQSYPLQFFVHISWSGSGPIAWAGPGLTISNGSLVQTYYTNPGFETIPTYITTPPDAVVNCSMLYMIAVNAAQGVYGGQFCEALLDSATLPGAITALNIYIFQVPNGSMN